MASTGEPHVPSEKLTEPDDSHLLSLENDNLYVKHNDRFVPCDQGMKKKNYRNPKIAHYFNTLKNNF